MPCSDITAQLYVDQANGPCCQMLLIDGSAENVFDLTYLCGINKPDTIGWQDEIQMHWCIPDIFTEESQTSLDTAII